MTYDELYSKQYQKLLESKYIQWFNMLKSGKLPKEYDVPVMLPFVTLERQTLRNLPPEIAKNLSMSFDGKTIFYRDIFCSNFGYPLYAENWIRPLAKWIGDRPCLEIMAGSGYLSYFLKQYGVNIKATDDYSLKLINNHIDVEKMDCCEAINRYGKDEKFVVCSWPFQDYNAYKAFTEMKKVNSNCRMIYIGEDVGGCTANSMFFDVVEHEDLSTFNEAVSKYKRWQGIYDYVSLLR